MALPLASDVEQPVRTTVARYAIHRLGEVPYIQVGFAETVDLMEPEAVVVSVAEQTMLEIPAWKGRTDLMGREVFHGNEKLGTVIGIQPATTEPDTGAVSPERVILDALVEDTLAGKGVSVILINASGNLAHRQAAAGRSWELNLPVRHGPEAAYAGGMLVHVMVALTHEMLKTLGDTTTSVAQLEAAALSLSQSGFSLDHFLTTVAEKMEVDRREGNLPFVQVMGQAPRVRAV